MNKEEKTKEKEIEKGILGILLVISAICLLLFMFGNSSITDCIIASSTAGLFLTSLFTLYIIFIERIEKVSHKKTNSNE